MMDESDVPKWDQDDDDEKEDYKENMYGGRDGLILLIDASDPMFQVDENDYKKRPPERSHILLPVIELVEGGGHVSLKPVPPYLKCCRTTMLNRIIGSDRDLMGIVLYGTYKTENHMTFPNISVLQELAQPSAANIKQIMEMLKKPNFNDFDKKYGHSDDFCMADALWLCQSLFSNNSFRLNSKSILLFTCVDNPHSNNTHRQHQTLRKAQDLSQVGIDLDLLHLGKNFDVSVFYKGLVQTIKGNSAPDWRIPNASSKLEELLARVNRIHYKKRSVAKLDFIIGENVRCSVGIYNLVRETVVQPKISLDRRTNETVKNSIRNIDAKGEVLLPSEVNKYQTFGKEVIVFSKDEVTGMRRITEPGLELVGFKPASHMKLHYYIRPSSFVYPEEKLYKGSFKLMAALLDRCFARRMLPICLYTPRRDATPKVVALIPQEEKLSKSGTQLIPPGFHLFHLPYAENIRNVDTECIAVADANQVAKAKDVITKLKMAYTPYNFENPKLQTHWHSIEALALDYNKAESYVDLTKPVYDIIDERLELAATEFVNSVYPPDYDPEGKIKAPTKRAIKNEEEMPKKIPKSVEVPTNMLEIATKGKVEKLKVDELKAYLQSEDIKVTGLKKAQLVDRVYEHLGIPQPGK